MRRAAVAALAAACLSACASGPPVGAGIAPRVVVAKAAAPAFPGQVPADEPGPAVAQPAPTTGRPDPAVPGAVAYDLADPALRAAHSPVSITYAPGPDGAPPVGGLHYPVWLNCGIYETPVPSGYAVHDLEHGAVWLTYPPGAPQDLVDQVEDLVRRSRTVSINGVDTGQHYLTVSPYAGQTAPLVVTAWAHQLTLQTFDAQAVRAFVRQYRTVAGVTPELGAPCSGTDIGTPLP